MEELGNELEIYHMYTLNCLGLRQIGMCRVCCQHNCYPVKGDLNDQPTSIFCSYFSISGFQCSISVQNPFMAQLNPLVFKY